MQEKVNDNWVMYLDYVKRRKTKNDTFFFSYGKIQAWHIYLFFTPTLKLQKNTIFPRTKVT